MNTRKQQSEALLPKLTPIYKGAKKLQSFNLLTFPLPFLSLVLPAISDGIVSKPVSLLISAFVSATCVQISRLQKSKLRKSFDKIWDTEDQQDNENPLEFLRTCFNKHVGKSKYLIGKDDLDFSHPTKRIALFATTAGIFVEPAMAPLIYLMLSQLREVTDSQRINASTFTTMFYLREDGTMKEMANLLGLEEWPSHGTNPASDPKPKP